MCTYCRRNGTCVGDIRRGSWSVCIPIQGVTVMCRQAELRRWHRFCFMATVWRVPRLFLSSKNYICMKSLAMLRLSLQLARLAASVGQLSPLCGTTLWQPISIFCNYDISAAPFSLQTVDWQTLLSYMPQCVCCDLTFWPLLNLSYLTVHYCNVPHSRSPHNVLHSPSIL